MNKEKNLKDQRASLRVDTRETQQINWRRRQDSNLCGKIPMDQLASRPTLGFPAQEYVTFTELNDQKFFRIFSFDDA